MQMPTLQDVKVRNAEDAHVLFHAVALGKLSMIRKRLDSQERRWIRSGCVYVWEQRNFHYAANNVSCFFGVLQNP